MMSEMECVWIKVYCKLPVNFKTEDDISILVLNAHETYLIESPRSKALLIGQRPGPA